MIAIRIATYQRENGLTPFLLKRTLENIKKQTYQNWHVFLVGDGYKNEKEFKTLVGLIPGDKITSTNMPTSPEREKYKGHDLWRCAGVTAHNVGLNLIKKAGIDICASVDDDDIWYADHLETLIEGYKSYPEAVFVYTRAIFKDTVLPYHEVELGYNNLIPREYQLVHSATSWNLNVIPFFYRNVIQERSPLVAADADLWSRISVLVNEKGLKTLYIPKITAEHTEEMGISYSKKNELTTPMI